MPAANRYTNSEIFLPSVRRKGHIPAANTAFQDADLLAIAWDELETALLRQIRTARENFYLVSSDLASNASNVYDIPYRAIGMALNDIQIVDGTCVYPVGRSEINEQFSTVSSPTGYWAAILQGSQVSVLPTVNAGVVRFWYMQRPNTPVVNTAAAQITAINQITGVLTFASLPSTFVTGINYDCINDQPPFGWRFTDTQPTSLTSTTMTFASLPTDQYGNASIQVGDWMALAGQTPVMQIPVEFYPLLVQRTVVKYYEIQGYTQKAELAEKKLKDMEKDVFELINPRIASEPKRIIPDGNVIGGYRRWRAWRAT